MDPGLAIVLGALIVTGLSWLMWAQHDRRAAARARRAALMERKADQVERLTDALLAARASDGLDAEGARRVDEELLRAARYLSDDALEHVSAYVRDELLAEQGPTPTALLELMLRLRDELGLERRPDAPAMRELRAAIGALGRQREAIAQIGANARQLFGALRKVAADEPAEWGFEAPREAQGAADIPFATTDGRVVGRLRLPYPPEPKPRVEASLEILCVSERLVEPETQKALRRALKELGYRRAEGGDEAVDPHDRFALGVVFDHPKEPYLSRATNLVDLLDDTRDAIDAALEPPA